MKTDTLTPEREATLAPLAPWVRFAIPSDEEGQEYRYYLHTVLEEMATGLDDRNRFNSVGLDEQSNSEGGIGNLYMPTGEYIVGFKLYWYGGTERGTPWGFEKGLLFRDHEDKGVHTVHAIFLVAEAWAEHLAAKHIPFTMYVREREKREQICHKKYLM